MNILKQILGAVVMAVLIIIALSLVIHQPCSTIGCY
jgi:hypothetical protein